MPRLPETLSSQGRDNWIVSAFVGAVVLTLAALGIWRAIALGADGVAAAGLVVSAAALLSSSLVAYERWKLKPGAAVLAVLLAAVLTGGLGYLGAQYFANQPVDVTAQINWPTNPKVPSTSETAVLGVPKTLNRLEIRVLLVDLHPEFGSSCGSSTYDVLRLGDDTPTDRVPSDQSVEVQIPPGVKRIELTLTVNPAPGCEMSAHIESAVFRHHDV